MMAFLSSRLGIYGVAAAVLFLSGAYTGFKYTNMFYRSQEIAALNRQLEQNKKVIAYQTEYVTKLRDRELTLEAEVEKLNNEADKDATAARPAISLDGVRRLNSIK
jgi:cell division protein FtsB